MRRPPSVCYPLTRPTVLGAVGAVVWAAGVLILGFAVFRSGVRSNWGPVVGLLTLLSVAVAFLQYFQWQKGQISWNGDHWQLLIQERIQYKICAWPQCVLALDHGLLLRVALETQPSGQAHVGDGIAVAWGHHWRWLWVARASWPTRWTTLRAAVFSRTQSMGRKPGQASVESGAA
jgi:hypothetical protein